MIEIDNITKIYDSARAVDGVSMTIDTGTITVIVGTSGSGKTTVGLHRIAWLAIIVSWFCFILIVTQLWKVHTDATSSDPAAFLRYAKEVQEAGGVTTLLSQLFEGTYSEANQHPLFTALLSFGPTFSAGKLLSLAIGILTLVLVTLWTARQWNLTVAAIVSVILSTNFAFCSTSAMVTCEGLLTLFISLLWLLLASKKRTGLSGQTLCLKRK